MVLFRKMIRDIWRSKMQFIAIFLMAALGVMVYSGIDSMRLGMKQSSDNLYNNTNLADLWIYTKNSSLEDINNIRDINGVASVEGRFIYTIEEDGKQIELIASQTGNISKPYNVEGADFNIQLEDIWLNREFAKNNDYAVGETIMLGGKEYIIQGLILSSEKVYAPAPGSTVANHNIYGYAYLSLDTAESIIGTYVMNQIVITLTPDAEQVKVVDQIEDILGTNYLKSIDRDSHSSVSFIADRIRMLERFTYIFPIVFLTLALLTMLTTMARMVENQRMQIGTLMATGYSRRKIMHHYVSYGLWIGFIGGLVGMFTGHRVIPEVIKPIFSELFALPEWPTPQTVSSFIAVFVIVICCIIAVLISCKRKMKDNPAIILRGNIQKVGQHTIIEKLGQIWNHLSFESKMMIRNISRNKIRSIMGIVGVLGCMMLTLTAFGIRNSMDNYTDELYQKTLRYQNKIELDKSDITSESLGITGAVQYIEEGVMDIKVNGISKGMLYSILDEGNLTRLVDHQDKPLGLPSSGLIISKIVASELKIKKGDQILYRLPGGDWKESTVADIGNMLIPKIIYLSKDAWLELDEIFEPTSILTEREQDLISLRSQSGIKQVIEKTEEINAMQQIMESNDPIIFILILVAILLGITIICNLGLLNFTEMMREYATLRVIGYYTSEVRILALRENLLLTIIGWLVGIPVGFGFLAVYMNVLSSDNFLVKPVIYMSSYVIATLITLLCSLGVGILLGRIINKIDMVTSLKSTE